MTPAKPKKKPPAKKGRTRARTHKKDDDWAERFFKAFASERTISLACKKAKVGRSTFYDRMKRDPEFAARFEVEDEAITEALEHEAYRRAIDGVDEPVFHAGEVVGTVKKYSDRMLVMLLKARRPEKYRERIEIKDDRAARRREVEKLGEGELDERLTGIGADVVPIERGRKKAS